VCSRPQIGNLLSCKTGSRATSSQGSCELVGAALPHYIASQGAVVTSCPMQNLVSQHQARVHSGQLVFDYCKIVRNYCGRLCVIRIGLGEQL
jgi:hypothetical protein